MVAEADLMRPQSTPAFDVQCFPNGTNICEIEDAASTKPPSFDRVRASPLASALLLSPQGDIKAADGISNAALDSAVIQFVPSIRSGSFADIGLRRYMEDEHIRIDDLSSHMGSLYTFPEPSAFYGVFDGHGGPEAAAYIQKNCEQVIRDHGSYCLDIWKASNGG
ncbi:hypothetical protein K1719_024719 [Acacia pycnantha]|nr:hypothetical protein K1719_024719 [Acacia pycnantha]